MYDEREGARKKKIARKDKRFAGLLFDETIRSKASGIQAPRTSEDTSCYARSRVVRENLNMRKFVNLPIFRRGRSLAHVFALVYRFIVAYLAKKRYSLSIGARCNSTLIKNHGIVTRARERKRLIYYVLRRREGGRI